MNQSQLISKISKETNIDKKVVQKLLENFSQILAEKLAKGEKVAISKLGTFTKSSPFPSNVYFKANSTLKKRFQGQ